jgi:hypothetical protein
MDWWMSSQVGVHQTRHSRRVRLRHLGYRLWIDVTLRSADLVPVFSFGENDVRSLASADFTNF